MLGTGIGTTVPNPIYVALGHITPTQSLSIFLEQYALLCIIPNITYKSGSKQFKACLSISPPLLLLYKKKKIKK